MPPVFEKEELEALKNQIGQAETSKRVKEETNKGTFVPIFLTDKAENTLKEACLEFQEILSGSQKVEVTFSINQPSQNSRTVRFFFEKKDAGFGESGLAAPYFELEENQKGLQGSIFNAQKIRPLNLSSAKSLEEALGIGFRDYVNQKQALSFS
jgi:hypothetical protein